MKFRAILILFFALGITGMIVMPSVIRAWSEPTAAPPSNNVPAPINVSADAQTKAGAVGFNGTTVDATIGISTTGSAAGLKSFSNSGNTNCVLTPVSGAGMTCDATIATAATGISVSGKFTKGANVYGETTALTTSNLGGTDLATLSSNGYGISAQSSTTAAVYGKANAVGTFSAYFEGGKGVFVQNKLGVANNNPTYPIHVGTAANGGIGSFVNGLSYSSITAAGVSEAFVAQNVTTGNPGVSVRFDSKVGPTIYPVAQVAGIRWGATQVGGLAFYTTDLWPTMTEKMRIDNVGNVGIGTTAPTDKLHVSGGNIRVTAGSFIADGGTLTVPDYVFESEYSLMSLADLEEFVIAEKHLPNIPNREQVKTEGVNVSEMQMKLLEKVEELTLYTIQQQKEIDELKVQVKALQSK